MARPARPQTEPHALPRPRLVACDIDGTLLDHLGVLRPAVVRAVGLIQRSGVEVMLATGRSPWTNVPEIAATLGLQASCFKQGRCSRG